MRIKNADMIRIARKEAVLKIIGTMKQGEKVPARIIDRQDRYFATISVRGNQLKAEFPGGVPGSNHLTLELVKKEHEAVLFKLIQSSETASFREKISDLLLLSPEKAGSLSPALLDRALQHSSNLLELHLLLLFPHKKENLRGEGISALLNRFLKGGVSPRPLLLLSSLLQGEVIPPGFFHYLAKLLRQGAREEKPDLFPGKEEDFLKLLNEVAEDTDNNEKKSRQKELVEKSLEIFTLKGEDSGYEIPVPVEDDFLPLKTVRSGDNWLFSIELSRLGVIDILVQGDGIISIFGESEENLMLIKEEVRKRNFDFSGIRINFNTRREVFDKLVAIKSFYSLNSQLDIKV